MGWTGTGLHLPHTHFTYPTPHTATHPPAHHAHTLPHPTPPLPPPARTPPPRATCTPHTTTPRSPHLLPHPLSHTRRTGWLVWWFVSLHPHLPHPVTTLAARTRLHTPAFYTRTTPPFTTTHTHAWTVCSWFGCSHHLHIFPHTPHHHTPPLPQTLPPHPTTPSPRLGGWVVGDIPTCPHPRMGQTGQDRQF